MSYIAKANKSTKGHKKVFFFVQFFKKDLDEFPKNSRCFSKTSCYFIRVTFRGYTSKTILAKQEAISTPESQVNVNDNIH